MKRLLLLLTLLVGAQVAAAELPYNTSADANADIAHALAQAKAKRTPVLLIFGANWCEDCRSLNRALNTEKNAALIHQQFQVVKIDVGNFDHNLDITKRYDDPTKNGIPAAVIVSPDDKILYSTKAGELSNARRMNDDGVYGFFKQAIASSQSKAK
ncbi:protein disulfide-isomerase [Rhodanobacter sp. ANJX3]|uniref:thioredoxin family protein n=1 Tax=unclassified Rhodanobacter TaxID=2621553 RepID=UPI0015C767B6|nr:MULTISPECIES: thioredoxin family protein [unclassified Rhodanobacter]MBB5359557.1 protein disulfide-isomerase [Rhodanobacter sp. ANJX3]NYE30671.1 protein disulfide-isomerase [Rhodanobacter sp. K2T2]